MNRGVLVLVLVGLMGCPPPGKRGAAADDDAEVPTQSAEELGEVVAQIDDTVITVGELQDRLNQQSPYIRARYTSLDRKKEFLDNLVRFEVLAHAAAERGYDEDPDVVRTMKQVMIQKLMKEEFENRVKLEDITTDEMRAFYKEHEAEFNKPEQVRVSAIVIKEKSAAQKVAKLARSEAGATNKDFRDLVLAHTEDEESKVRGGDLRYFEAQGSTLPEPVVKAAFELKTAGDVAGPVETDRGYYIIKQTGRRQALSKSFEEVERQIQNRMYREKRTTAMETYVKELMDSADIDVYEDKLADIQVQTSADAPVPDPHEGAGLPTAAPGTPGVPPEANAPEGQ